MSHADANPNLPPPPDPRPDPHQDERTRPVPPHIADVLALLHILLAYGRHLALTLDARAAAGRFAVIAQFFGTARLTVIRARLARGLLRIQALQRVLLNRARRGRDLVWRKPRPFRDCFADDDPPQPPNAPPAPKRRRRPPHRRPDPDAAPDPDNLPTLAQLEAQIRRLGIGRAIADICRDFGVAPCLCDRRFFSPLFDMIDGYRGNVTRLATDFQRRRKDFIPEWDFNFTLGMPDSETETITAVLGFFIGERWPVLPSPMPLRSRLDCAMPDMPTRPP